VLFAIADYFLYDNLQDEEEKACLVVHAQSYKICCMSEWYFDNYHREVLSSLFYQILIAIDIIMSKLWHRSLAVCVVEQRMHQGCTFSVTYFANMSFDIYCDILLSLLTGVCFRWLWKVSWNLCILSSFFLWDLFSSLWMIIIVKTNTRNCEFLHEFLFMCCEVSTIILCANGSSVSGIFYVVSRN